MGSEGAHQGGCGGPTGPEGEAEGTSSFSRPALGLGRASGSGSQAWGEARGQGEGIGHTRIGRRSWELVGDMGK